MCVLEAVKGLELGGMGNFNFCRILPQCRFFPFPSASLRLLLLVLAPCTLSTTALTYILSFILSVLLHWKSQRLQLFRKMSVNISASAKLPSGAVASYDY